MTPCSGLYECLALYAPIEYYFWFANHVIAMGPFFVARDSASIQTFSLSQLSHRNHHGGALTLAGSLVAVTNTRIKVDGIANLQSERFGAYRHIEVS
jgi:hypothetical protein